tara:strand:- start:52526 stop:52897 length:372 start_codon:yes stop_codon:yes gene_type:complete
MTIDKKYQFLFSLLLFLITSFTFINIISSDFANKETVVNVEIEENESNEQQEENEINTQEIAVPEILIDIPVACLKIENTFIELTSFYSFLFKEKLLIRPSFSVLSPILFFCFFYKKVSQKIY